MKSSAVEMTARIPFCLLLFLTGCCDCMLRGTISPILRHDATRYCHICANHTMCQFPVRNASLRYPRIIKRAREGWDVRYVNISLSLRICWAFVGGSCEGTLLCLGDCKGNELTPPCFVDFFSDYMSVFRKIKIYICI